MDKQHILQVHRARLETANQSNFSLLQAQNIRELRELEESIQEAIARFDRKAISEMDTKMIEQQTFLQKAGVPEFYPTKEPQQIQTQSNILRAILAVGRIQRSLLGPQQPTMLSNNPRVGLNAKPPNQNPVNQMNPNMNMGGNLNIPNVVDLANLANMNNLGGILGNVMSNLGAMGPLGNLGNVNGLNNLAVGNLPNLPNTNLGNFPQFFSQT
eukprot:TRINITY_DN13448_c0_g1_i1.p1 TRINITY_DN13448_c0_g1~~TRINITY_DN13448_c0_g1_i1.p1  ORF type:complete len:243 (+),score=63.88 TRINITY_DN13448_c0_g1_i1:92-730(+)